MSLVSLPAARLGTFVRLRIHLLYISPLFLMLRLSMLRILGMLSMLMVVMVTLLPGAPNLSGCGSVRFPSPLSLWRTPAGLPGLSRPPGPLSLALL